MKARQFVGWLHIQLIFNLFLYIEGQSGSTHATHENIMCGMHHSHSQATQDSSFKGQPIPIFNLHPTTSVHAVGSSFITESCFN